MPPANTMTNETQNHLSFRLSDEFVESYAARPVSWGFPSGGGNTLGELTFIDKYSRLKPDGSKERWHEACRRVIEGMYSILKDHCQKQRTPWNHAKAARSAEDAFERLFTFKWTPPGRGLAMMGTEFVARIGSAALQNCAFLSTATLGPRNPVEPFVRLMEMLMLGIGVGFDTKGADKLTIQDPTKQPPKHFVVPDTREGWCQSVELLLRSYLVPNQAPVTFDYSLIRPKGAPIRGFGGTAAGSGPLISLHDSLHKQMYSREGEKLSSRDIVDIQNKIGKCVKSGNVRRSAEIAFGGSEDQEFLSLKDWELNPERMGPDGWGNISNNSIIAEVGGSYDHLLPGILLNGEPGLYYLNLSRQYGRLGDPQNDRDYRAMGSNPCVEQTLEDKELCTLVETYPVNCDSREDYMDTLKVAYLYGKAVTLLPTHWEDSNEVMQRNRRIGCSVSGIVQFVERHNGWTELRRWLDEGYELIQARDTQYSEWLGVRESIKTTSIKPSGTVSLLAGVTPGVHFPVAGGAYFRRMRFSKGQGLVSVLEEAGYHVEDDVMDPEHGVVVTLPTMGPEVRSEKEATIWEKMSIAALAQEVWADNSVSATFTFMPSEAEQVVPAMHAFDGRLKCMSFMQMDTTAYPQMPYEAVPAARFEEALSKVQRVDVDALYALGEEAKGERYCTNDTCEV